MQLPPHRPKARLVRAGLAVALLALGCAGIWLLVRTLHAERPRTADTQPPTPLIVAYRPTGPAPLHVRLDASGSIDNVGVTAFRWDFDDGTTGEGPIVDHVFRTAGTFKVQLWLVDASGQSKAATQTVVVQAPAKDSKPPHAVVRASVAEGRVPLSVDFDATASTDNREVVQFRWNFDDDTTGEGAQVTHVFTAPGSYDVRLTVADAAGNTDEVSRTIEVLAGPPSASPKAVAKASTERISAPGDVTFDGRDSHDDHGVIAYLWDFGDGTTAHGPIVTHRYSHAGRFVAHLEVRDESGNSSQSAVRVHVEPPQVATERVIFDDRWAPAVTFGLTDALMVTSSAVRNGRNALQLVPQKPGASLTVRFEAASLDAYDRLGFWLLTDRPAALAVRAILREGSGERLGPATPVRTHLLPGAQGADWQRASIPLAAIDADGKKVIGFVWTAASGATLPTFAIDDIALLPPDDELPVLSDCVPPPPIRGFVERRETGLFADDVPFRAVGANLYYVQQELSRHLQRGEMRQLSYVRQALSAGVCAGINVIRVLGFNDNPPETQDEAIIQTSPGVFREEGLRGLDLALAEARRHHLRVILTLTNNWGAYGGLPRYAAWAEIEPRRAMTDPQVREWIIDYAKMLSQRVNTFTGIRYSDDPTILAIELANELRCQGCKDGRDATALTKALAQGIAPAWPNHLIADGGEGFDDNKKLYPGLEDSYVLSSEEGSSYSRIAEIPEIDLVSYHLYPDSWSLSDREAVLYIDTHEAIARNAGKIAYLGEFGLRTGDVERGITYDQWLQRLFFTNGGALGLVWQLTYPGRPDNDGFALIPGQSLNAISALSRQANRLLAPGLDGVSVALVRR